MGNRVAFKLRCSLEQICKIKGTIWENAAEQKQSLMRVQVEEVVGENGQRRHEGRAEDFCCSTVVHWSGEQLTLAQLEAVKTCGIWVI